MTIKANIWLTLMVLLSGNTMLGATPAWTVNDQLRQPGVVRVEFIFDEAPHPQCHASTIVETPAGLVAAWFGGTKEKHPDVGIWLSRHVQGPVVRGSPDPARGARARSGDRPELTGSWTAPVEVANGVQYRRADGSVLRYACWNPVLFQPRDGPLMLFYKCGPEPSRWWGMLSTSADGGQTWSIPRRLPEGLIGPVKNKPLQLADGTIVCPSSTEHDGWRLHLETTRDLGATWTRIGPLNDGTAKGAIQPSILVHPDGRWQLLARDRRRVGSIWTSWSDDGGRTWSELESTGLPNPSSGTDAVTLADGRQLVVYNHTQRASEDAEIGDSRGTLNLAVSDDGAHWQAALLLERSAGEYSYPTVIQSADGLLHVTYTWHRERIKHFVIDPAKLKLMPIVAGKWPAP